MRLEQLFLASKLINAYNAGMFQRILLCFSFLLFSFYFCSCGKGCESISGTGTVSVVFEQVKVQESSPTISIPGVLIPRDRVDIKLQYPAKIADVFFNKGDVVTQGAVLARLSEEELNLKVNQLRAQRVETEAVLEKNQGTLKNRDRLLEEGKIDRTQYDAVAVETSTTEATLNRIKADLAVAEYNLSHSQIVSPISGVITEKYASPQQLTTENQTLFTILNVNPILVSFPLTADESAGINVGMPIIVRIEDMDNQELKATISYIAPEVHQPGKTFEVWASIPNDSYVLKSGMQVVAEFTSTNIHKVIVVPASAVITRNRDKFVFTVNNGVAKETKVGIRSIHNNIAEISAGLAENDVVAIKGAQGLQDGSAVEMWRR